MTRSERARGDLEALRAHFTDAKTYNVNLAGDERLKTYFNSKVG